MTDLNKIIEALDAVTSDPGVTVDESWRRGLNNIGFTYAGSPPPSVTQLARVLKSLDEAEDLSVCHWEQGRFVVTRPTLLSAMGLRDRVATVFLTTAGLQEAIASEALLSGSALVEVLQDAAKRDQRLCVLWDEPSFRVGDVLVSPLRLASDAIDLPIGRARPSTMIRESIGRLVIVQSPEATPRPDVLLPLIAGGTDAPGPAFRLFRIAVAAHAIATLARELPGKGRILFADGRGHPGRLTMEPTLSEVEADTADRYADSFEALQQTVLWVFDQEQTMRERQVVAGRELSERLGAIAEPDAPILAAILDRTEHFYEAAQTSYTAYVNQHLDRYFENRKELIGEVRALTGAYSEKARGLIAALARDALAGTILTALVSLRILGTSAEAPAVPDQVFWIIAGLVVTAGVLQIASAAIDFRLTKREFSRWIDRAGFLLSNRDREDLVEGPRRRRSMVVVWTMVTVSVCYVILGFGIASFPAVLPDPLAPNPQVTAP